MPESTLPRRYLDVIDKLVEMIRDSLQDGRQVQPVAFFGSAGDLHVHALLIEMPEGAKDAVAAAIAEEARKRQAGFILTVLESYLLIGVNPEQAREELAQYGAVSRCPSAKEAVLFQLETRDVGTWLATPTVSPVTGDEQPRTMGEVEWGQAELYSSRFLGLIDSGNATGKH